MPNDTIRRMEEALRAYQAEEELHRSRGYSATHVFVDDTPVEVVDAEITTTPNTGGQFVAPVYLVDEYAPGLTQPRVSLETLSQQQERLAQEYEDYDNEPDDWDGTGDCDCSDCRYYREEEEDEPEPAYAPPAVMDSVEDIERWLAAHA